MFELHWYKDCSSLSLQTSVNKKEELEQSVIEMKEQQTKPDCRDVAVQNSPEYQEMAVQTYGQATAAKSIGKTC